jgi:hypothetical protein
MYSRRLFLKNSAVAMFGMGAVPGWLSRAVYAKDASGGRKFLSQFFNAAPWMA